MKHCSLCSTNNLASQGHCLVCADVSERAVRNERQWSKLKKMMRHVKNCKVGLFPRDAMNHKLIDTIVASTGESNRWMLYLQAHLDNIGNSCQAMQEASLSCALLHNISREICSIWVEAKETIRDEIWSRAKATKYERHVEFFSCSWWHPLWNFNCIISCGWFG